MREIIKKASNYALVSKLAIPAFWYATGAHADGSGTRDATATSTRDLHPHFLIIASGKKFHAVETVGRSHARGPRKLPPGPPKVAIRTPKKWCPGGSKKWGFQASFRHPRMPTFYHKLVEILRKKVLEK